MTQNPLENPIFNCEYEILELLGEGMAAEVFLCKQIKTGNLMAIKFLKQAATKAKTIERQLEFDQEHQMLQRLDH